MKKCLCLILLCFCVVGILPCAASGLKPQATQVDEQYLLGLYAGNGEQLLVREQAGHLEILYRYLPEDQAYTKSNVFPLVKERYDVYRLRETGPMTNAESTVKFERDKDGYGISCNVGGNRYTRKFFGEEKGEPNRLKLEQTWEQIRGAAAKIAFPVQTATHRAELVNLATIVSNLKYDLRYAGANNLFGAPLYVEKKVYLDKTAATALQRVQKKLASYGYGLVVWEAYRPWQISALAYEALPAKNKYMLPKPEEGYSHNTGMSIDVGLYELATGKQLAMISGFDEPSPRQYSSFNGGTSLQRWQRDFLQQQMLSEGFTISEMEWWHFDYDSANKYQLLNKPLAELS
ncbi:MAG: M15 family metallopeptidase [Acidaminococcaceae bacterium]